MAINNIHQEYIPIRKSLSDIIKRKGISALAGSS